jgi:hypothetical protein
MAVLGHQGRKGGGGGGKRRRRGKEEEEEEEEEGGAGSGMARIDGWRANILVLPAGLADDTLFTAPVTYTHVCHGLFPSASERGRGVGHWEWGAEVGSGEWAVGSWAWGVASREELTSKRPASERWCLFHISPRPSVRAEYKVYFALGCTSVLIDIRDIRDMLVAASFGRQDGQGGMERWGEKCGWLAGGLPRKATRLTPDRMWMPPLRRSR